MSKFIYISRRYFSRFDKTILNTKLRILNKAYENYLKKDAIRQCEKEMKDKMIELPEDAKNHLVNEIKSIKNKRLRVIFIYVPTCIIFTSIVIISTVIFIPIYQLINFLNS